MNGSNSVDAVIMHGGKKLTCSVQIKSKTNVQVLVEKMLCAVLPFWYHHDLQCEGQQRRRLLAEFRRRYIMHRSKELTERMSKYKKTKTKQKTKNKQTNRQKNTKQMFGFLLRQTMCQLLIGGYSHAKFEKSCLNSLSPPLPTTMSLNL